MPPGNANVIEYIDNSGKKKTTFQQPKTKMGSVLSGWVSYCLAFLFGMGWVVGWEGVVFKCVFIIPSSITYM